MAVITLINDSTQLRSLNTLYRPCLILGLLLGLLSCSNVETLRIRQLLVERGFGTRAEGVATMENYVSGGDGVVFIVDPAVLQSPGAESLAVLTQAQFVGLDGTILIPYVGPVSVLGLTESQLKDLVETQLQSFFNIDIRVTPRIVNTGKVFFAFGEVRRKGQIPFRDGDFTIMHAITEIRPTALANLGRVRLIRPDALNPLVMEVNFREMIMTGNTAYNVALRENDFIYVPPTWMGSLARFVEKLLQPLAVGVRALLGAAAIRTSYDVLRGEGNLNNSSFLRF